MSQKAAWLAILMLIAVYAVVRFAGLDRSPPGFHTDEAVIATEAIALAQTGYDAHHQHRLFTPMDAGGAASPTHLYPKAAWVTIAGYSIAALRAYAGLEVTLLLAGLHFLGRARWGPRAAVYVLLAGSLSPWIFQFSRLAVDDPVLSLCGLVWGMYFFLRPMTWRDAIAAATCLSISAYAYSSGRVMLVLLVPLMLWAKGPEHRVSLRVFAIFAFTGFILCLPIGFAVLRSNLLSRYAVVGILTPQHLQGAPLFVGLGEVLWGIALHLSPDYLFVAGDANRRHSTQFTGEFSWLDTFALLLGLVLIVLAVRRAGKIPVNRFVVLCLAGFMVGILPAALTWEGIPHSIRGSGCWPFVALLTGFVMRRAEERWRWALPACALVAVVFAAGFLWDYFRSYPLRARDAFYAARVEAAERGRATGDWKVFARITRNDPPLAARYFLIAYAHQSFEQSGEMYAELEKPFNRRK